MAFRGEFDINGTGVHGWAASVIDNQPVWVEILADGESMGCVMANIAEPHGCGFWLPLPPFIFENGCKITARIANTNEFIGRALRVEGKKTDNSLAGEFFVDRGICYSGWAVDTNNPDAKVLLRALVDGEEAATCVADRAHHDPNAHGHAFFLHLPVTVADGGEHEVALVDREGRHLPGSPLPVCLMPASFSAWLENRQKLEKKEKDLVLRLLKNVERRIPAILPQMDFAAWKKIFAAVIPASGKKFSCAAWPDGAMDQMGTNGKISADYMLLSRQGEKMLPVAVNFMAEVMEKTGAAMAYADAEDSCGAPLLKPAWDREAFLARDYLGPVLVRKDLADLCRDNSSYSVLRLHLALRAENMGGIIHIARPLSVELPLENDDARVSAISAWLDDRFPGSKVCGLEKALPLRISYNLVSRPRTTILIPTRDHGDMLERCLASLKATAWDDLEIIIIDNGTTDEYAVKILNKARSKDNVRVLHKPEAFNFAALNNAAAREATGELLCFLNNDTEVMEPDWLAEMASLLLSHPDNGCVGAKLLWPGNLVQHAGVIVGTDQLAAHVGNDWRDDEPGYMWRNQFAQQYSAVTAACMLTPKKLFMEMNGFDARRFAVNFNDTDYCLRLREAGKRVLWTPFARLVHHESASRGNDESAMQKARGRREMNFFRNRWGRYEDPFYNPCLPLSHVAAPFYGLSVPPRPCVTRKEK